MKESSHVEIRIDELPNTNNWKYTTLYKESLDDDMLYWQVGYSGNNYIEIEHGIFNGKNSKYNVDVIDSAIKHARKLYKLKYREGYRTGGTNNILLISDGAMKANKYTNGSIKNWPVYTQVKLHGIGMLCQDTVNNGILMRSRLNNDFYNLGHIKSELEEFFEYLPKDAILDGELYNHNISFSTLTSIIKTTNNIHVRMKEIVYWIFDINYYDDSGTQIEKRYELLINAFRRYTEDRCYPKTFGIVPVNIAMNHDDVVRQHNEYVSMGYEGIMVKNKSDKNYKKSLYVPGRGSNILKYKDFDDEEGIIISVNNNSLEIRDIRNNIFNIKPKKNIGIFGGLIGKKITFRYQGLDINGIPKNAIGIAIRDYE